MSGFNELLKDVKKPTVSNPVEDVVSGEFCGSPQGADTSHTVRCANRGCGYNDKTYCSATGTECFGYISIGNKYSC